MPIDKVTSLSNRTIEAYHSRTSGIRTEDYQQNEEKLTSDETNLKKTVQAANELLEPTQVHIQFELHEKLDEYYVKVINTKTDEIIKEIPTKKWLDFYAAMVEFMGFLVDRSI
ncbi:MULTISPECIES: flagellar protein FlaG [Bacillus]|uniref:Flagellar protein FlaG n=2 Tax=Bacillus TaxID=1386 RepID=A0A0M4FS15_9BACI|nr:MULTISPECIES: flagellar protein FlaG [Bacillus]ALC82460.1 flagellar protein FlaG [Bacillus gobiensis]MBP1081344.1 flagellar protein FlaG [Bacillus capparidis]MED1096022.1 flagellar protein FlaG [Bacillus capparidis]